MCRMHNLKQSDKYICASGGLILISTSGGLILIPSGNFNFEIPQNERSDLSQLLSISDKYICTCGGLILISTSGGWADFNFKWKF